MSRNSQNSRNHPSGQSRIVLSEEEYTATLTSIVQRDFFPDLPNLERQSALLERRAQRDVAGAVAVRRAARRLADHEEALAAIEADDENDVDESNIRRRARPLHQESVTGFHARVTNEDDEEFDFKQKQEVKANRERLEKLFRPAEDSNNLPMLTNMASDQFEAESNRIAANEWNKPNVRNSLFLPPTPLVRSSGSEANTKLITNGGDEDDRKRTTQQLALMPPPENKPSKSGSSSKTNESIVSKHALVEYIPKHSLEKKIEPSQTRFPQKIVPLSNRSLALAAAAVASGDDTETDGSVTDASTDLDAPMRSIEHERRSRQRKRDKNHKSYVAMTPLVVPGAGNQSPITTWGTIDSTPLVLSGQEHIDEEEPPTSRAFLLSTENEREKAARKAELELARRAKRAKTPNRSKSSLTPAARALLEKTKRTPSRPRDAFASALRTSYTPKPAAASSSSRFKSARRQSDTAHNATPLISRTQK